jgi:hypothetical protein
MGKKSRRNKKPNTKIHDVKVTARFRAVAQKAMKAKNESDIVDNTTTAKIIAGINDETDGVKKDGGINIHDIDGDAELSKLSLEGPLEEQQKYIRQSLIKTGTDVVMNDDDPMGNGDQSPIESAEGKKIARDLFTIGGDIDAVAESDAFSTLAIECILGKVNKVKRIFSDFVDSEMKMEMEMKMEKTKIEADNEEEADNDTEEDADDKKDAETEKDNGQTSASASLVQPWSRNEKMKKLLETRETSLRLSPLLLVVAAGESAQGVSKHANHSDVAYTLLKYGANPNAQDVFGKNVCHYGIGHMANPISLEVVDMCIFAAKSAYFYSKDVELHGLKTVEMNGKKGVGGGFDVKQGRRSVYLLDERREIWVKPENIRLLPPEVAPEETPNLGDLKDRLGTVGHDNLVFSYTSDDEFE